jgi:hypothetical protein
MLVFIRNDKVECFIVLKNEADLRNQYLEMTSASTLHLQEKGIF